MTRAEEPASRGAGHGRTHEGERDDAELLASIDEELAQERRARRRAPTRVTGAVLLVGSAVSWISGLVLLLDKLYLLAHPTARFGCDINPFISCGSVMMSWQAAAFGIPNMALGLGGYAILGVAGAMLLSRSQTPRWWRGAVMAGLVFAFGFVHFLAFSAIFEIQSLCLWCMLLWSMTAPMFFSYLAHLVEERAAERGATSRSVLRHWVLLTLAWYVLVIVVILAAFWSQWMAMAGL